MGRVSFPAMGKKPKDRRGCPAVASRLQRGHPRTPGIYGGPIPGGYRSLSGAGETTTAPATAPLPLPLQNQDGLDSWTKRARLIAQGLISAEENRRVGLGPAPTGQFRSHAIRWPPQPQNHFCCAVLYERSLNRRRGGPMWPPACSPPQNVSPSLRRGGACPSRRISEMAVVRRRGESQTRPPPVRGNGSVRRTPTRTLCHGWSEPGAAVKWCRPKFCADQGPVARKESTPGTVFCAPEILWKGVGVSPVNGGPGVVRLWAGTPIGAHPPAAFWFLFCRRKRNSPKGRNPPRGTKPFRTLAGGSGDPPLQRFRRITAGRENGRGRPLPYGTVGKHSAPEDAQKARRPAGP